MFARELEIRRQALVGACSPGSRAVGAAKANGGRVAGLARRGCVFWLAIVPEAICGPPLLAELSIASAGSIVCARPQNSLVP